MEDKRSKSDLIDDSIATIALESKRSKTSAEQPVPKPIVTVNPTDFTEQLVAGTTIMAAPVTFFNMYG